MKNKLKKLFTFAFNAAMFFVAVAGIIYSEIRDRDET